MKEKLKWVHNQLDNTNQGSPLLSYFTLEQVKKVGQFQRTYERFEQTPLHHLEALASYMGVEKSWLKMNLIDLV